MRLVFAALLFATSASAAEPVTVAPAVIRLDATTLAGLPRQAVDAKVHEITLHCEGVALVDVLRKAGAMSDKPLRGADLARVMVASASDGYRVAFSLGELDPTLGGRKAYLVDRCNDAPLDAHDGPMRLLLPEDGRPARSVRQVESLRIENVP